MANGQLTIVNGQLSMVNCQWVTAVRSFWFFGPGGPQCLVVGLA
jgi:hypothetical protein